MPAMGLYERYVLPHVIDMACGIELVGEQRAKVVGAAYGVVLEPGIGGGLNLPHYDAGTVAKVIGVDPSIELGSKARERAKSVPFRVELHSRSGEVDVVEAGSVDTVVLTYTLCTVPDPAALLQAAFRALRPQGRLLFCEHARAPDSGVRRFQRAIEPAWKLLAGGCHLTRVPGDAIREAGFAIVELEEHYVEPAPRFVGFHQLGQARKPSAAS